jgi:hypothetical protein
MPLTALDYEEIRQLLARYNFAVDFGDVETWAGCFTPEGVFHCTGLPDGSPLGGRHEGRAALVAYATTHFSLAKGNARHWNWNLLIEGDGDEATMQCYLATAGGKPNATIHAAGVYRHRLRKVDGRWLFVERHINVDPQPT